MAAVVMGRTYYKEHQGIDHLSRTFQSNLAFSPGDTKRRTVSLENFARQRDQENRIQKTPWGRRSSYGGLGPVSLPDNHRPKTEPGFVVQKGHRHISSGACIHPRYVSISEKYALTQLRRSNLRASDELIEAPTKVDVAKHLIELPFPAEHPYATHIPRTSMFPPYETPGTQPPSNIVDPPRNGADVELISKSRGAAYRYEKLSTPEDKQQKPLEWLEGPNFFHLKGKGYSQKFYPIPPKSLDPNMSVSRNITTETEEALRYLKSSQLISTYKREVEGEQTTIPNYTNLLEVSNSDGETEDSAPGTQDSICDDRSHGPDETTGTEYVQKSVQFATNETSNSFGDKDTVSIKPSEKAKESSPRGRRSFLSASYPPMKLDTSSDESKKAEEHYEELTRGWSRSDIHRQFNRIHKDQIPDLRRKPDLRITTNERRHHFPELGNAGSFVWNGLSVPYRKGIVTY